MYVLSLWKLWVIQSTHKYKSQTILNICCSHSYSCDIFHDSFLVFHFFPPNFGRLPTPTPSHDSYQLRRVKANLWDTWSLKVQLNTLKGKHYLRSSTYMNSQTHDRLVLLWLIREKAMPSLPPRKQGEIYSLDESVCSFYYFLLVPA